MQPAEFAETMAVLESGVRQQFTDEQRKVWYECLKDLPVDDLRRAVIRYLQEDGSGWPAIGTLRKMATEAGSGALEPAQQAFERLVKAVRLFGFYEPQRGLESLDAVTRAAVERVGGWNWACDLTQDNRQTFYAQFRGAYQSVAEQEQQARQLPGDVRPMITNDPELAKQHNLERLPSKPQRLGDIIGGQS